MTDDQNPDQRRDAMLLRLLKTPPQQRPKRERSKEGKSTRASASPTSEEKPARSA